MSAARQAHDAVADCVEAIGNADGLAHLQPLAVAGELAELLDESWSQGWDSTGILAANLQADFAAGALSPAEVVTALRNAS